VAPDYERVVFGTVFGDEVWLYRSNGGSIRVNAVGGAGTEIWKSGDYLVVANTGEDTLNVSVVDRNGNVLWAHRGRIEPVERSNFFVSERGDAAVRTSFDSERRGYAILSDGMERDLPGPPAAAPDAAGWVPFGLEDSWGFANVRSGSIRRAPLPPAPGARAPFVRNGRLVYLALDTTGPVISVFSPDGEARIPIPADLAGGTLVPTDVGGLLTVNSVPRAVVDVEQTTLRTMSPITHEGYEINTWTHGSWGILVEGTAPLYAIELSTGFVRELAQVGGMGHGPLTPAMNDGYAIGLEANGAPAFWVERESGRVEAFGEGSWPGTPILRPMGSECVPPPARLLDDGSVALGVRVGEFGAVFARRPGSGEFNLVGSLLANVDTAGITIFPDAWIVAGYRAGSTGCGTEPPAPPPVTDALLGDSVQVVLARTDVIYENTRVDEFLFQSTGRCGLVRGMVDDFPTGVRTPLPSGATQVTFW
jgi:hypothetical protein